MRRVAISVSAVAASVLLTCAPAPLMAQTPSLTAGDRSPCRDPWINYAYRTEQNRAPVGSGDAGECNIYLYAGGRWQNYAQLRDGVNSWVRTTGNAGRVMRSLGGTFQLVDRRTGGQLRALVRVLDQAGATKIFDMMGQLVRSFGLMSTDQQVDLGNGSTLVVR